MPQKSNLNSTTFGFILPEKAASIEIADHLIDSITDRFLLLANHPYLGRSRDEELRVGLRSFTVGEYVIICRVEGLDVLILHVVRGSRDIEGLFGQ